MASRVFLDSLEFPVSLVFQVIQVVQDSLVQLVQLELQVHQVSLEFLDSQVSLVTQVVQDSPVSTEQMELTVLMELLASQAFLVTQVVQDSLVLAASQVFLDIQVQVLIKL